MKTSRLNRLFLLCVLTLGTHARGEVANPFTCLRDILTVTDRGNHQPRRRGVERPFMINDRFLAFPEVVKRQVVGFFVYDASRAYHYDTVEMVNDGKTREVRIENLRDLKNKRVYQMVGQPAGLETVTLFYVPGFNPHESNGSGPVMLGSSVLPVMGAFVSRPEAYDEVYHNPSRASETTLKEWAKRNGGRAPAAADAGEPPVTQIVKLLSRRPPTGEDLWAPLKNEVRIRRAWIQRNNLDDRAFKEVSRALDQGCRAP